MAIEVTQDLDASDGEMSKRFYVPGVTIKSICPECGEEVVYDLGDHYLSYPILNTPYKFSFCHDAPTEDDQYNDHEWTEEIIVRVTIEAADD